MWLRWSLIAAGFATAIAILFIFLTGDSECRAWQQGYTVVYEEIGRGRTGPLIESQVIEEMERRVGPLPEDCAVPKPIPSN